MVGQNATGEFGRQIQKAALYVDGVNMSMTNRRKAD